MGNVESIEDRIKELSPEELTAFREWFIKFDAEAWDRQFEADVKAGKLDHLAVKNNFPLDRGSIVEALQRLFPELDRIVRW